MTYNGWGIAFDGEGSWNFDNGFTRNVIIFVVDNSSSSHTDNPKNNFLGLDKVPSDGINDNAGAAGEKKIILSFINQIQNFAYVYITMVIKVTCMKIKQRLANLRQI